MKLISVFFFILFLTGCAHRSDGLPYEITLKIKIDGVPYEEEFELDYKDGMAILTSFEIEKKLGLSSLRTSLSYIDKHKVQIELPEHEKLISFSSFRDKEERVITNYLIGFADTARFRKTSFSFLGTYFSLVVRNDSFIDQHEFKSAIYKIWNAYQNQLGTSTDVLTFVELDWEAISGKALAENVFALFSQKEVPEAEQVKLKERFGWTPKKSTLEYVQTYYGANSWNDYIIGILSHDVALSYFGFGQTREKVSQPHELWFSQGLALLYGMDISKNITGKYPQLFVDAESVWKSHSLNTEIDQRLINPQTANDGKFSLDRNQTYAQAKARSYLNKLRLNVGTRTFNKAVKRYLLECSSCSDGYQNFKRFLPASRYDLMKTEKTFSL